MRWSDSKTLPLSLSVLQNPAPQAKLTRLVASRTQQGLVHNPTSQKTPQWTRYSLLVQLLPNRLSPSFPESIDSHKSIPSLKKKATKTTMQRGQKESGFLLIQVLYSWKMLLAPLLILPQVVVLLLFQRKCAQTIQLLQIPLFRLLVFIPKLPQTLLVHGLALITWRGVRAVESSEAAQSHVCICTVRLSCRSPRCCSRVWS